VINLVGTQTITVVSDDVDIFQNGQNFNCYQIDLLGGGTIFGDLDGTGIGGTWTVTEHHYYTKSDLSWVKLNSTFEETLSFNDNSGSTPISTIQDGFTSKRFFDVIYNPPFEANKGFPLTVGKSWSAATTETTKTETTINGNTESTTESEAYTKTFLVLRKESISSSIGETEAYVIKRTDPDGAYAETYYSQEVGTDVKMIEYDSTGTIQSNMELLSYEYQSIGNDSNLLATETFTIIAIGIILAISVLVTIYVLKKKKTDIIVQTNDA
jgi:tetrahydromethanopterin S-methyltransferase subunit F